MSKSDPVRERTKSQRNTVCVVFETTLSNGKVITARSQRVDGRSAMPVASIEQAKTKHRDELIQSAALTGETVVRIDVYEEVETIILVERIHTKRTLVELNERRRGELWG